MDKERLKIGKKRALHLLERKDYCKRELVERLQKDGYETELIEEIIAYIDRFHYLDDVRVAGSYIRVRKHQKSKRELEYKLKQRGISDEDIALAMEENYETEDETSQEQLAIKKYLQKYHLEEDGIETLSYEEKQKIATKLYRKGFASEEIRRQLQM